MEKFNSKENWLFFINCFLLIVNVLAEFFNLYYVFEEFLIPLYVIPAFGVGFYFIAFTSIFDILKFKKVGKLKKAEIIISIINLIMLIHIWFFVLFKF